MIFEYGSSVVPRRYKCDCGATNCKLWCERGKRQFVKRLYCWQCIQRDGIENLVPAYPTQSGLAVWMDVDDRSKREWDTLPYSGTRPEDS